MQRGLETTKANSAVALALGDGYGAQVETAFALGGAIRQLSDAEKEAGRDTEFYGEATAEAAAATADAEQATASYARSMRETAEAARALMDGEKEAADARRAYIDSSFAARDAQRDLNDQLTAFAEATAEGTVSGDELQASMDETAQTAGKLAESLVQVDADESAADGGHPGRSGGAEGVEHVDGGISEAG